MATKHLSADSRYRGIVLTERELSLLYFIHEAKVLSSANIHLYYEAVSDPVRTRRSITKRLKKFTDAGVLVQMDDGGRGHGKGFKRYFYRLGMRGFDLLYDEKRISQKEYQKGKLYGTTYKLPSAHNIALSSLITELAIKLYFTDKDLFGKPIFSKRGERHRLFLIETGKGSPTQIVPDWVIETDERIVCVEMDTGTQPLNTLTSKFSRYRKVAEAGDKPIHVLFVCDNERTERGGPRYRERRVGNIKELMAPDVKWPKNLHINVAGGERGGENLYRLVEELARERLAIFEDPLAVANHWLQLASKASKKHHPIESLNKQEPTVLLHAQNISMLVEVRKSATYKVPFAVIPVMEGSVRDHQKVRKAMAQISEWNRTNPWDEPISLLLIYSDSLEMSFDVLGIADDCPIYLTNLEYAEFAAENPEEGYPPLQQVKSPYTREVSTLL